MMNHSLKIWWIIFLFFAIGSFLLHPDLSSAQSRTHTVVKGDTLWDICKQYYGDYDLWPKLWEMNPFVTNPHLLKPGDIITLMDLDDIEATKPRAAAIVKPPKEPPIIEIPDIHLDISRLTAIDSAGAIFFNEGDIKPCGKIVSTDSTRVLLEKGDRVYVKMDSNDHKKPGDRFTVFKVVPPIKYPEGEIQSGYTIDIRGILELERSLANSMYEARLIESFEPMHKNDPIMSYKPLPPCYQPRSVNRELKGTIVSTKNQELIIGKGTVVYIDKGFGQGVRIGNLFHILRTVKSDHTELGDLEIVTGNLIILDTGFNTSTALVLNTDRNVSPGAHVQGISWVQPPPFLSRLPSCELE